MYVYVQMFPDIQVVWVDANPDLSCFRQIRITSEPSSSSCLKTPSTNKKGISREEYQLDSLVQQCGLLELKQSSIVIDRGTNQYVCRNHPARMVKACLCMLFSPVHPPVLFSAAVCSKLTHNTLNWVSGVCQGLTGNHSVMLQAARCLPDRRRPKHSEGVRDSAARDIPHTQSTGDVWTAHQHTAQV